MRKPPKPLPFRASKEAKRRARLLVGSPRPSRRQEADKHKPPKHPKRSLEMTFEA